ncbi:hypothetical protein KRR40_32895 [Niabella defluvii]|nr:hypothetical protein KRR40_32895 [Niabella sp. I65]
MIYMQALRFITDYINDDIYYGARYPKHNLVRATIKAYSCSACWKKRPFYLQNRKLFYNFFLFCLIIKIIPLHLQPIRSKAADPGSSAGR